MYSGVVVNSTKYYKIVLETINNNVCKTYFFAKMMKSFEDDKRKHNHFKNTQPKYFPFLCNIGYSIE